MRVVGANGLCCGTSRDNILLTSILGHVRNDLVQVHGLWRRPSYTRVSARSFPVIFWLDAVHFPWILQPNRCKTAITSRHFLRYSLHLVGPPDRDFKASDCLRTGRSCLRPRGPLFPHRMAALCDRVDFIVFVVGFVSCVAVALKVGHSAVVCFPSAMPGFGCGSIVRL